MADDIITSVVAGLLIAAISAIAAGLWHQLKNLRSQIADEETRRSEHEQLMADMRRGCEHEKLVDEALRTLLLCKLEQQQDTMVHDHHGVADNDFKLRAQRVYDAYHGLGGNGPRHPGQQRYPECAHCAPAGRKAIMSITINGVKPGTATLTIRADTQ